MDGKAMYAQLIVREAATRRIIRLVEVPLDEQSVAQVVNDLSSQYGPRYLIDQNQVELARAAAQEAA
jgi:hypothetical protein